MPKIVTLVAFIGMKGTWNSVYLLAIISVSHTSLVVLATGKSILFKEKRIQCYFCMVVQCWFSPFVGSKQIQVLFHSQINLLPVSCVLSTITRFNQKLVGLHKAKRHHSITLLQVSNWNMQCLQYNSNARKNYGNVLHRYVETLNVFMFQLYDTFSLM